MPDSPDLLYFVGRTFQLTGLLVLPSAIWAVEVQKSEPMALGIFFGGIGIFVVGSILAKRRRK